MEKIVKKKLKDFFKRNMSDQVFWKMRNGELISVDDMDINHLRNTLKMIIRNNNQRVAQKKHKVEIKLYGDMANEFHESHHSDEDDDRFDDEMI